MRLSLKNKLVHLVEQHQDFAALMADPDVMSDTHRFQNLAKEYAQLEPLIRCYEAYQACLTTIESARELLKEADPEMKQLAEEELNDAQQRKDELTQALEILLIPKDPNDDCHVFLEVRAGTGGDEAALFAGDLFRMYARYVEQKPNWSLEILSESESEQGGYKEIVGRISGDNVHAKLKFESGAHRVQRVPVTESQGRIHTSACTVAVLPEVAEIEGININAKDLKVDTYRASGAGGQHVNKTDSAIRLTHLPTGFVVECQDERSQHKNRARAMGLLKARLLDQERTQQQAQQAQTRRNLVGSGDRSERIRTYNFPQRRVTDHRINLTLYKLEDIMNGDLEQVIEPLCREYQADQLALLSEQ